MFRLLEFIVLFLLAYKLINELFGRSRKVVQQDNSSARKTVGEEIHHTSGQSATKHPRYDNAESIDFEEVK